VCYQFFVNKRCIYKILIKVCRTAYLQINFWESKPYFDGSEENKLSVRNVT